MDVKLLSIEEIGLSVRSYNALHRAGVHTVADMLGYTEESLAEVRNLGKKSIDEILQKIEEYKTIEKTGTLQDTSVLASKFQIPEDFDSWIAEDANKQMVLDYLRLKELKIDELELLSARAYNLLQFAGYDYLYQIVFLSSEQLMGISRMDEGSSAEIQKLSMRYIREKKDAIFAEIVEQQNKDALSNAPSIFDLVSRDEYREIVLQYVKENDIEIERMELSNRPKKRLLEKGYTQISDIIFKSRSELQNLPSMGSSSIEEIFIKMHEYMENHKNRIVAVLNGDVSALWDDTAIQKKILDLYQEIGFGGLHRKEMKERLHLPEQISEERLDSMIEKLLAEKELECVDGRYYRVYGKFEAYLENCTQINERSREFIRKRLDGVTLEAIAQEHSLTRERVRQVVKKELEKVRNQYTVQTGMRLFYEDYFQYLYENYEFEKKDGAKWLGVPEYVWNYLELNDIKQGKKELKSALDDHKGLDAAMRLKIKNYLNRNKLYIDGMWVEKRRVDLERVLVKKFCTSNMSFDEFFHLYNAYLEQENIPYDEDIYYTENVYRTRKNHLSEAKYLLWKLNEQIRYYDIEGRDYTELLEVLNMDSYENIELSTLKFMKDYPEIMEKYDIRDQYELHNLLRKIVPEGSYHDFRCKRMPEIEFGTFDRDAAILDILIDNAPITTNDLVALIHEEYGYDPLVIMANYLQPFSQYYHQGMYSIDQKQMSQEHKILLQSVLTEDFYYIDEVRKIYAKLLPEADIEEINPYNLKAMGFQVYSRYILQNHASLEAFYSSLLTSEDMLDITSYKKRFLYVQMFWQKLKELKQNLEIIEFEPNQILHFRKLEQAGISREMIQDFCNEVYDFVEEGNYFSVQSLRQDGFESELYDLGFSDWFYANLLISDERFSYGTMFGNLILYKGKENITIKSFALSRIQFHRCIDVFDLMTELTEKYGCKIVDKYDVTYKIQGTEVFHDKILDRLYANEDLYYMDLD